MAREKSELISQFFANIGVAWFTAGVIGIFVSGFATLSDIIVPFSWGIGLSTIFLVTGTSFLKK